MTDTVKNISLLTPPDISHGLFVGKYVRRGSVIQHAVGTENAGKTVAWLREASRNPVASNAMGLPASMMSGLQLSGSICSFLNLGATVAFGIATLRKLDRISGKIADVDKKIDSLLLKVDRIQWAIDVGFDRLESFLDSLANEQILRQLKTAAHLASVAQAIAPTSSARTPIFANALTEATSAFEGFYQHISDSSAVKKTLSQSDLWRILDEAEEPLKFLNRFRLAVLAANTRAAICAELKEIDIAAETLEKDIQLLTNILRPVGTRALQGPTIIYDVLLNQLNADKISPTDVGRIAARFDSRCPNGLPDIIRLLQKKDRGDHLAFHRECPGRDQTSFSWQGSAVTPPNLSALLRLVTELDGAWEDLERLDGHLQEYKEASLLHLSIQDYREKLKIDSVPDDNLLVVIAKSA